MAVTRTVLPRKGIIQPKHGDNYEADLDQNWLTIDNLLQDAQDVQAAIGAAGGGMSPTEIGATPVAPGNFIVPHGLGAVPFGAIICMTSGGAVWFQTNGDGSLKWDDTNLYLVASAAGVTARVLVW
ncbi:MAG: hypothetical protein LAP13_04710 [Acidobacteriia bacterium]|nr:hypothetical protein [Terriglobia bacterium]